MNCRVRKYQSEDLESMRRIWNEVVEEANAFPQEFPLKAEEAEEFFASQSYTGVAELEGKVVGVYILHPNNVGRCGHIANASYAVLRAERGKHIGEALVIDSLVQAREKGFRILQFNAVVSTNIHARRLYENLGFIPLGTIKGGFRKKDGSYEDIVPYYKELSSKW